MTTFRPQLSGALIQVSDVLRSRQFYEALGFVFYRERPSDGSIYARVGGAELTLHPDLDPTLANKERGAGANLVFWVEDVDAYWAELRDDGIETAQDPQDRPWGREFWLRDPDGYVIEFLGPRR